MPIAMPQCRVRRLDESGKANVRSALLEPVFAAISSEHVPRLHLDGCKPLMRSG